ncbi:hypothetical protein AZE42_11495 [Rhizopogon vesiculosus]|uniref:Heterokaryon incompatibility domain-containing protein n=1 Tax=Rhizopogon vesiculosus TaxID=180088 RepID=A0A1J8PKI5_9AGAM|nr:hypothetical protein AZE42_11495 [Rhizopogon vesiculosus]
MMQLIVLLSATQPHSDASVEHLLTSAWIVVVMPNHRKEGESTLDRFDRYVMNEIPIRLIRLVDMKFVGRNDIRNHFQARAISYAVLSHRWLAEGEPSYEEMKSGTASGPGYEKLKKFCEKAREHNVEYAWSDTCCIDKSSSTELDESIRSMFRWYRNSEICIVHLAQSETIENIVDDEWTERGWTLQELLAPYMIKLFNKHWMPMTGDGNDKSDEETKIMKTLERATGIHPLALMLFRPGPVKVDERMTWAARRKTTRVEDVAYSLMGIFDVSLQIAYGEGGDRAFCRLFEAIMQAGDPSVLNWTGDPLGHHSSDAIPQSPQSFVGRTLELPPSLTGGRLEMTMTGLGLRIPVVILPLKLTSRNEVASGYEVIFECLLCPTIKINSVTLLAAEYMDEYALGIVNYSLGSGEVLRIRGKSAGFILTSGQDVFLPDGFCQPILSDFVGLEIVSPPDREFVGWKKLYQTGLVEVNFPNIPSESFFYINRKYLEIVYL